jgi:phage tail protein X
MNFTQYTEHITTEGDRWDYLAWIYYQNPYRYEPLLIANPEHGLSPSLPSGLKLKIPVLAVEQVRPVNLPPWKR